MSLAGRALRHSPGMGQIRKPAKALLCRRGFDEALRAITR